jgi:hypothetical protein
LGEGKRDHSALDVAIELYRKELAVDHVAFQLSHVDAVGGKAAKRLVERSRQVARAWQYGIAVRLIAPKRSK